MDHVSYCCNWAAAATDADDDSDVDYHINDATYVIWTFFAIFTHITSYITSADREILTVLTQAFASPDVVSDGQTCTSVSGLRISIITSFL